MARKPETVYYTRLHKKLPTRIHREKMANPYRGGTWDCWYDGPRSDLWIEYKWVDRLPPELNLIDMAKKPSLSRLQQDWGRGRLANGRQIGVILGTKAGGYIFLDRAWEWVWSREDLEPKVCSDVEVNRFIETITCLQPGSAAWRKNMSSISISGELKT